MKKYLVIGNPIEHSLSPKLHNYWLKKNNINALYEKRKLNEEDFKDLILEIKKDNISGANITVPFKKKIISCLDHLSPEAESTQSVNTIYLKNNKIMGHNTDIIGFERAMQDINYKLSDKKILILGAGGVVSSLIFALKKRKVKSILICNRTKEKAESLKDFFKDIIIINWGEIPNFDMVINATSIGLKLNDKINLDFSKVGSDKFFYDVIYNPKETDFLKEGQKLGNRTENGKKMFIYQAAAAFKIWHGIEPKINNDVIALLD